MRRPVFTLRLPPRMSRRPTTLARENAVHACEDQQATMSLPLRYVKISSTPGLYRHVLMSASIDGPDAGSLSTGRNSYVEALADPYADTWQDRMAVREEFTEKKLAVRNLHCLADD